MTSPTKTSSRAFTGIGIERARRPVRLGQRLKERVPQDSCGARRSAFRIGSPPGARFLVLVRISRLDTDAECHDQSALALVNR